MFTSAAKHLLLYRPPYTCDG